MRHTCLKCVKQGRWAAACKSTVASDDEKQVVFVLCSVRTTKEVTESPNGICKNIFVCQDCTLNFEALIDPASLIRL